MLLVDSTYINVSGGKVLLEYFLKALLSSGREFMLLSDNRWSPSTISLDSQIEHHQITASEKNREFFYAKLPTKIKIVLCFANVPPPIRLPKVKVFILFHNAYILKPSLHKSKIVLGLMYLAKRTYISFKNFVDYTWIVQTPYMEKLIRQNLVGNDQQVDIIPFFDSNIFSTEGQDQTDKYLYVAAGYPLKNHSYLFKVWKRLLDVYEISPTLYLTIEESNSHLIKQIESLKKYGLNIQNLGYCSPEKIKALYSECRYLIFPSTIESFGLPLMEAASAGCKVIAIDHPYVFDVIKPSAVFNVRDVDSLTEIIYTIVAGNKLHATCIVVEDKIKTLIERTTY